MAELTVEDYKRGARKAMEANDVEAAKRLIAKAREIDTSNQTETSQPVPDGSHRMPDGSVMKDSEMQSEGPAKEINGPMQGFGAAFRSGIDAPLENIAETANVVGANKISKTLSNLTDAPENYESASAKFIEGDEDGSFAYSYLPKAAVEQIGQYAGSLITRAGGAAIGTAVGGPVGGIAGGLAGPAAFEFVQQLGPIANERARNNGRDKPNKDDFMAAAKTAAASGALNALIPAKGGIIKRTAAEAATEGAQSVVEQTGSTVGTDVGLQVSPRQAVGEAIIGGTSAGGVTAVTKASKTGGMVLSDRSTLDPEVDQAAGEVARLLTDISKTEGADLKRVDAATQGTGKKVKKGANQALDEARSRINREVSNAAGILKNELGINKGPIEVKTQLDAAIAQSRNKVSSVVSNENIQFIKDNFGQTEQGQLLVAAFRKSNVVTELYAGGLKGGVSQFTDQFNPLPTFGRSYNPAGGVAGNLNAGAAVLTGGGSLAVQIPAVVGGRVIDAVTGRRSKVARFVKQNRKKAGFEAPTGTSVIGLAQARKDLEAQKRKAESQKKKQAAQVANDIKDEENAAQAARTIANGDPPNRGNESTRPDPRGVVWNSILDKRPEQNMTTKEIDAKIKSILYELQDVHKDSPERLSAIEQYLTYLETGRMGSEGRPLSEVAALVSGAWDSTGPTSGGTSTSPNPGGANPKPLTPKEDGKQSNIAFNQELVEAVNNSRVRADNKAKLLKALGELRMNLGSDPVAKATEIVSNAGVSKPLAKKYLNPYLERIVTQQAAARAKGKKQSGKTTKETPENPEGPDPRGTAQGGRGVGVTQGRTDRPVQGPPLPSPALVTNPTTKPTTAQVKNNLPEAKAIIEIGKKGTKYENGIQDWNSALEAAKILNQTVSIFSSNQAMARSSSSKIKSNIRGYYQTVGRGGGNVFGLKIGGTMGSVAAPRTEVQALTTLLHEIAHGITLKPIDGNYDPNFGTNKDVTKFNKLTGEQNDTTSNSFVSSAILPILSGPKYDQNHPVIQEVINLQQNVTVYQAKNNASGRMVRDFRKMSNKAKIKSHLEYTLSFNEFAVDPVWVYMFDPKMAKEIMPQTSKLIQSEFAKAGNKKIQFYSHPLASVLAVVTAMVALGSGGQEEEEERQSTGVLTV